MVNNIIGYVVAVSIVDSEDEETVHTGYIHHNEHNGHNYLSNAEPAPIPHGDAYRRLAAWLDENPDSEFQCDPEICERRAPVAPPTPVNPVVSAAKELGGLLKGLAGRHGIQFGLSDDEIEARIALELKSLGASGSAADILKLMGR